jgi:ABC-type branched-subunit amino acid transport system ATPase component
MAILELQKLTRRFGALTTVDAPTISVEPKCLACWG